MFSSSPPRPDRFWGPPNLTYPVCTGSSYSGVKWPAPEAYHQRFMEHEGSLLCSQELATIPYPESAPPYFPNIQFNIIFPSMPRSSEWFLPFRFPNQNIIFISHLSNACYKPRPSHPHWLDHPNNIRRSVQVTELFIMLSSPASCRFLALRSKFSPQHPVLKHPQSVFFP